MAEAFTVLIMAAGQGTRMRSDMPKVLHPVCGVPMVEWVVGAAREAGASRVVCVTRPGDGVAEGLGGRVEVAEQSEGEGTGSAVLAAADRLGDEPVVVLSADHPLISPELIRALVDTHVREGVAATLLTTDQLDPAGYGRVVRADDGSVARIVETKHADQVDPAELAIEEINIGSYAFEPGALLEALDQVGLSGDERYLTAAIPLIRDRGGRVAASPTDDVLSAFGVNDRADLAQVERLAAERLIARHVLKGVGFAAPDTVVLDASVEIGRDTVVEQGVTLRGHTRIGDGCRVGPHTTLVDARVGDGVSAPHSYLVECEVKEGASVGPFAYLRPGTIVGAGAKVGTFVEVKNSEIGAGAKVPHLSYIGDADIGEESNVGAGAITANYDGRHKHRTKLGKGANTGVHTSFVAPVSVGDRAYTGAGSVITDDVPDGALGISRPEQKNVQGYAERVEKETEE